MLLGLGVDILSVARLEGVMRRRGARRLAERICCAREYAEFCALDGASAASTPSTASTTTVRTTNTNNNTNTSTHTSTPNTTPHAHAPTPLHTRQLRFLSSRWAAKEAAYKALPFRVRSWRDLDLRYAPNGRPVMVLAGDAAAAAGVGVGSAAVVGVAAGTGAGKGTAAAGPGAGAGTRAGAGTGTRAGTPTVDNTPSTNTSATAPCSTVPPSPPTSPPDGGAWFDRPVPVHLLVTISHDAGVVVAAVVAQRV